MFKIESSKNSEFKISLLSEDVDEEIKRFENNLKNKFD